jgi:hypothetical protein
MDQRTGQRYLAAFPILAEWDDNGKRLTEEGETENVGPTGALVHLQRLLPNVGSKVKLKVSNEEGQQLEVTTEVLRLERNAAHPQAALMLMDKHEKWQDIVWEHAAIVANLPDEYDEID